eukprot:3025056-Prymnesium_polylepis.2
MQALFGTLEDLKYKILLPLITADEAVTTFEAGVAAGLSGPNYQWLTIDGAGPRWDVAPTGSMLFYPSAANDARVEELKTRMQANYLSWYQTAWDTKIQRLWDNPTPMNWTIAQQLAPAWNSYVPVAYDTAMHMFRTWTSCIDKGLDTSDVNVVTNELQTLPPYQGVSNRINIDENGELQGQMTIFNKLEGVDASNKIGLVDSYGL